MDVTLKIASYRLRSLDVIDQLELRQVVIGGNNGEKQHQGKGKADESRNRGAPSAAPQRYPADECAKNNGCPQHIEKRFKRQMCHWTLLQNVCNGFVVPRTDHKWNGSNNGANDDQPVLHSVAHRCCPQEVCWPSDLSVHSVELRAHPL